ncbi:MAG TPA: ATPase, T2SS/T4P/T4SS family, partial [Pirellulaceae bacterium]|nr:ATPase, T2SS/T4P/T4SS family [Pirellulaceae bacterium]
MKWLWQCLVIPCFAVSLFSAGELLAQSGEWPPYRIVDVRDEHTIFRGSGGYFAWWKLLLIGLTFVAWIKAADWINRDAIKFQEQHGLAPEVWNPVVVIGFLLGLFGAVINIPFFLIGFPLMLLLAYGPPLTYLLMRWGKVDPSKVKGKERPEADVMEEAATIENITTIFKVKPSGETEERQSSNLIRARQAPTYPVLLRMLYDLVSRRTELMIMDFTRESAAAKIQIDGVWHDLATFDRPTADSMLASLKYLANLNPADRRTRQKGNFDAKARRLELRVHLDTHGVPTGERVNVRFETKTKQPLELTRLGLWPDEYSKLRETINARGMVIVSAPPGHGLTTTWRAVLQATDRFVRDWVSLVDRTEAES